MNLLDASNLSHSFDYDLFYNVSLSVKEKETVAIIGVSGSGKSTLLHILSTLLQPQKGVVEIFGEDVKSMDRNKLSKIKRDDLGLVFQSHYLFKGFSAMENLEVAAMLSEEKIDNILLKKLNIYDVINQKVTELSGGQQQRVSIARVLTKKPKILFLDEPTGNLDKQTASDVIDIFFEYVDDNNAAMILVTHDEDIASRCENVYKLENKELIKIK